MELGTYITGVEIQDKGAVEACFFERPRKTALQERGFQRGNFLPSCMVESRT